MAAREREGRAAAVEVVLTEAVKRDHEWWRARQLRDESLMLLIEMKEGTLKAVKESKSALKRLAAEATVSRHAEGSAGKAVQAG